MSKVLPNHYVLPSLLHRLCGLLDLDGFPKIDSRQMAESDAVSAKFLDLSNWAAYRRSCHPIPDHLRHVAGHT